MRVLYFLIPIITLACSNEETHKKDERKDGYTKVLETRQDSLFHDVMQGHDVGMAKMGKITRSINAVQSTLDSIASSKKAKVPASQHAALEKVLVDLRQAEAGMHKWMQDFKLDSAIEDPDKRETYLLSERTRVNKVRDDILRAIATTDSLLAIR